MEGCINFAKFENNQKLFKHIIKIKIIIICSKEKRRSRMACKFLLSHFLFWLFVYSNIPEGIFIYVIGSFILRLVWTSSFKEIFFLYGFIWQLMLYFLQYHHMEKEAVPPIPSYCIEGVLPPPNARDHIFNQFVPQGSLKLQCSR